MKKISILFFVLIHFQFSLYSFASISNSESKAEVLKEKLKARALSNKGKNPHSFIFDLPITYNHRVSHWIRYFQSGNQKKWFREYLQRSYKFMPLIQTELQKAGLPQDLAYMVMVESGFSTSATSHADAAGPWQFIEATGNRYGLQTSWWLDERRDIKKSTVAAIKYIQDLYSEFGSWYLVVASYNMGESGLRRQIQKYKTQDFWQLSQYGALPQETMDYVPKIIAAILISKAPNLYGFRNITQMSQLEYDLIRAPGGTNLDSLADHLNITRKSIKELNSELIIGYIPKSVPSHFIKIPRGAVSLAKDFFNKPEDEMDFSNN